MGVRIHSDLFASLIALLPTIPGLPKRDLHNMQSALRTAARAFGNPPETWIIESVPHLRIVDQDLWERVQARLGTIRESPMVTKLRATRFWEKRRAQHLLTGRAVCGVCDKLMAAVGRDYLACNHARRNGACAVPCSRT